MNNSDYIAYLSVGATLIAAFLGSWSAFKLEDRSRKRERVAENIEAGNKAMFTLLRMFNVLFVFQQRALEPLRKGDAKSIILIPSLSEDYEDLRFEVGKLFYLLGTDYQQLLSNLVIEEERFHTTIQVLNKRSSMHEHEIQPLLEKAGIVEGGEYSEEEIRMALGPRFFPAIQRLTESAFMHVDKSVESLLEVSKQLHSALKSLYPKAKIIRFEPDREALDRAPK